MFCTICNKPIDANRVTCGDSYCQEANFFFHRARNSRKNSKKQREAYNHALKVAAIRQKQVAQHAC